MPDPKIKMVCRKCGGDNVLADAYAHWDVETQRWELDQVFPDKGSACDDCGGECRIDEAPLEEAPPVELRIPVEGMTPNGFVATGDLHLSKRARAEIERRGGMPIHEVVSSIDPGPAVGDIDPDHIPFGTDDGSY